MYSLLRRGNDVAKNEEARMKECESCKDVGIRSEAITVRNGERVCGDCARDIDQRESEQLEIREVAYDERGVREWGE